MDENRTMRSTGKHDRPKERELELLRRISTAESDYLARAEMLRFGTPIEYVVGFKQMGERKFKVDRRVYIPDSESSHLVSLALEHILPGHTVVDVGTGCGWIAISLKLACPNARVIGTDIEAGALELARENAMLHHAEVEFVRSSFCRGVEFDDAPDVIVADLPYGESSRSYSDNERAIHSNQPETAVFPRGGPVSAYVELVEQVSERGWQSKLLVEIGRIKDSVVKQELEDSEHQVEIVRTQDNGFVILTPRDPRETGTS